MDGDEATRKAYLVKIAFDVITKNAAQPYVTKKPPDVTSRVGGPTIILPTKPKEFII